MAGRDVVWTKTADLQFAGILEFWVRKNKSTNYSKRLVRLVSERTKQIADNPLLYKVTNFKDIRVAPLGNFSIYYRMSEAEIIVMAFWDNRQDPKGLNKILRNLK